MTTLFMEEMYILKELNKFNHITFYDENHTYESSKYGFLISVTTCLKKFEIPFEEEFWLKLKTIERNTGIKPNYKTFNPNDYPNLDTSEIKSEWDKAKLIGTTSGSQCHDYLENRWLGKVFPQDYTDRFKKLKYQLDNFYSDYSKYLIPIRLEQVVGTSYLAGQIDGLFWDTKRECIVLIDYKTDKKIDYTNRFQKFKYPLESLDNCNYNKYTLQTNLYKFILEEITNLKIEYIEIIWFNVKNDNYQVIPISTNMKKHVNSITNYIQDKNYY